VHAAGFDRHVAMAGSQMPRPIGLPPAGPYSEHEHENEAQRTLAPNQWACKLRGGLRFSPERDDRL